MIILEIIKDIFMFFINLMFYLFIFFFISSLSLTIYVNFISRKYRKRNSKAEYKNENNKEESDVVIEKLNNSKKIDKNKDVKEAVVEEVTESDKKKLKNKM